MNGKELCEFCDDCEQRYCFLRSIVELDHKYNKRLLMQMKMVEVYKYQMETAMKKEIGWQDSLTIWVESGMAKKFAEAFDEKSSVREMKKKLFQ
jgi:ADP-ribosylglycohydrolase